MSSSARTVILGSWARTWKRMRVGYVGTPETSFLDSILLVTVSWQSDRVRHAKFSQEYVTHFLSSSSFVSFLFFCQKSILVNNARVRRLRLDIEAGGLNVRKWFGEWCRVSATGSLRITERIIESIKPVKWETAASLTAHISFVIECLLAQRIIWVVWMEGGGGDRENNDGWCDSGRETWRETVGRVKMIAFSLSPSNGQESRRYASRSRLPIVILHFQCPPFSLAAIARRHSRWRPFADFHWP